MNKLIQRIQTFNIVPYLVIFYLVGITGLIVPVSRELFIKLVPVTLLLSFILLMIYHGTLSIKFILSAAGIFAAGFLVEIIGVNTGILFGSYSYGTTLGPELFHTPWLIGINWLMLVYCSVVIASRYMDTRYFTAVIAAVLMVVYDFVLEPSAIDLRMWSWGGPVPLQNYIAWLLVGFLLSWFALASGLVNRSNKIAAPLFFIQLGFFLIHDLWIWLREALEL